MNELSNEPDCPLGIDLARLGLVYVCGCWMIIYACLFQLDVALIACRLCAFSNDYIRLHSNVLAGPQVRKG